VHDFQRKATTITMAAHYYTEAEMKSCAQHVEAKALANKLWAQWSSMGDKLATEAIELGSPERIARLSERAESIKQEFDNLRRGLMRCCAAN
jgi:hypothetical protein